MPITVAGASVSETVDLSATVIRDDICSTEQGPDQSAIRPVMSYRLFITDSRGRISSIAEEVRGFSDEDAFAKAIEMVGQVNFELWERDRRVATPGHGEREISRPGD